MDAVSWDGESVFSAKSLASFTRRCTVGPRILVLRQYACNNSCRPCRKPALLSTQPTDHFRSCLNAWYNLEAPQGEPARRARRLDRHIGVHL